MKILFTSDWQCDYENLDLCKRAADEILQISSEYGVKILLHAGDLKHAYNPIDVRVANFWLKTIGKLRQAGLTVFVNLGNHDRVGMHVDKQNWFPIIRKATPYAYDDPAVVDPYVSLKDMTKLAFLPFRQNPVVRKSEAKTLAQMQHGGESILVFHSDLAGARYNVLSRSESTDMTVEDLYPEKYMFCIGGHLHFQHKVKGNVWYVGSPFATDWGEANQKKGYLLIDTEARTIKRIRSRIPGWYDPSWPGFEEAKPESWQGAKVRIKVPCSEIQYVREQLEKARVEAANRYKGAEIVVVPEFSEGSGRTSGKIRGDFPDEKKIRVYVQETLPDDLRTYAGAIKKYLVDQLALVGGLQRENGELKFTSACTLNFLSYRKLSVVFEPGLTVVAGENKDWKGRSNGAGKSSYLQLIAVAHSGLTFKGQKHDGWMRRGTKKNEECSVRLWFKDAQGRNCFIKRARQPKELVLKVDKEIVESGNRPENTQKLIEQVTGYTWETLANAIYIDQASSHLMLTGTEGERKGFLAKLQNLERFERAEKAVRNQKTEFERRYESLSLQIQSVLTEEKNHLATISDAKRILALNRSIADSYKRVKRQFLEKSEELEAWENKAEQELEKLDKELTRIRAVEKETTELRAQRAERKRVLVDREVRFKRLEGTCPTCEQPIDEELIRIALPEIRNAIKVIDSHLKVYDETDAKCLERFGKIDREASKWRRNKELSAEVRDLQLEQERLLVEWRHRKKQEELLNRLKEKVSACRKKRLDLDIKKNKIGKWLRVLKYSQSVFQRNGLPAYLNEQICPELNQSAVEYSELFAQGEIQVRFAVDEEGRMDVKVINAHGGEGVEDQSEGEMKMASLITSFAVRSVAPKTNILILDEPGDGLDPVSARGFAKGLKQVVNRFGCILLTTHNQYILSELADAKLVVVKKENGISEVVGK
jgi:DNA repair exonuclease SbcCD ATPase subunit/DNA repair exonuclease SbcCD nuclease subunit